METLVKQSNIYTYFWWVLPQYRGRGQIVKSEQNTYQAVIISAVVSKLQHQIIFNLIVQQRFCDIPHASKSMTVHPYLNILNTFRIALISRTCSVKITCRHFLHRTRQRFVQHYTPPLSTLYIYHRCGSKLITLFAQERGQFLFSSRN